MNRETYLKNYRAHRINVRERRLPEYADSPSWAVRNLTLQPCALPQLRQSEIGKLLIRQRDRRRRAEERIRGDRNCRAFLDSVDRLVGALKRKYDASTINRFGPCRPIIVELVRAGQSMDEIADYFDLPLLES